MNSWRHIQRQNFTNLQKLFEFLEFDEGMIALALKKTPFPLNLPLRLAQKIEKKNINDPLLKQFLPSILELEETEGFSLDPVQDLSFRKENKLLHKYEGRALLVCTSACAMNCRYCFRKNFDYETTDKFFTKEFQTIQEDPSLTEIILSGGDPLSLNNEQLNHILKSLSAIPHIKRIRFHTRFLLGIPERLDADLIHILETVRPQLIFVIHCNHPKELDEDIFNSLKKLQKLGALLLNQSVLLKGVNDNLETLKALSESLVNHGILPYYLHQLDKVQGSAHFEVEIEKGLELIQQLPAHLPGYAVPKYVQEIAGEKHKTLLNSSA